MVLGKSSHFWCTKKLFRNLAASHRTWNVTKYDENVMSHHFVTVPHSNPGPVSGKIPTWNDPDCWDLLSRKCMPAHKNCELFLSTSGTCLAWRASAASGGALALELPCGTHHQPQFTRKQIVETSARFLFRFFGLSLLWLGCGEHQAWSG